MALFRTRGDGGETSPFFGHFLDRVPKVVEDDLLEVVARLVLAADDGLVQAGNGAFKGAQFVREADLHGSSLFGGFLEPLGGVAAHGSHGEADDGPAGEASVGAFHAAGEDRDDADRAEDVADGAFHGLSFCCVKDVLGDDDAAGADKDFVLDVLHVMDHLAERARARGLHVDALRLAGGALRLRVALSKPAATVGLLGLGVDLFHNIAIFESNYTLSSWLTIISTHFTALTR